MEKDFYVYMMASDRNGTIYKGMTSNLTQRVYQHKHENGSQFTSQYGVKKLVWYKHCENWENAVSFEKRLRRYKRSWKMDLIEEMNPGWCDLWDEINGLDCTVMPCNDEEKENNAKT